MHEGNLKGSEGKASYKTKELRDLKLNTVGIIIAFKSPSTSVSKPDPNQDTGRHPLPKSYKISLRSSSSQAV